ncbi:8802_t:CDS:2 [Entrophospora sp. SA101]|nr:8802_t:CDS:2 [Entrophospora sp. SA101]
MTKIDNETLKPIPPNLGPNEKELVLLIYEECILNSNDWKRKVCAKDMLNTVTEALDRKENMKKYGNELKGKSVSCEEAS